jgi:hypothetical protein
MSVRSATIPLLTKRKADNMSANVYTIKDLLVGTSYSSRTLQGEIISADEHPHAVWYDGCETYLVEVQPNSGYKTTFRTVAVKVGA